ncbi:hypothetical protein ONS95_008307 [Cadophora gregata]|uniref:uncharacterized protein n=1 Tax=Cadophora gregata TaxID=51156 RepID=UPI0026DCD6A3|nr:uncharacterized protein ONS95_008307 [Cadophora gregata]KAK0100354.1 hypothetical protein ONS96_007634 [Cadophora gregata f. sp. sojae]KAK0126727.1 hypothetical protein ONS95_008307 [Cadophora gregata]
MSSLAEAHAINANVADLVDQIIAELENVKTSTCEEKVELDNAQKVLLEHATKLRDNIGTVKENMDLYLDFLSIGNGTSAADVSMLAAAELSVLEQKIGSLLSILNTSTPSKVTETYTAKMSAPLGGILESIGQICDVRNLDLLYDNAGNLNLISHKFGASLADNGHANEIERLRKDIENLKSVHQSDINNLQRRLSECHGQLENSQSRLRELEVEKDRLDKYVESLEDDLQEIGETSAKIRAGFLEEGKCRRIAGGRWEQIPGRGLRDHKAVSDKNDVAHRGDVAGDQKLFKRDLLTEERIPDFVNKYKRHTQDRITSRKEIQILNIHAELFSYFLDTPHSCCTQENEAKFTRLWNKFEAWISNHIEGGDYQKASPSDQDKLDAEMDNNEHIEQIRVEMKKIANETFKVYRERQLTYSSS